MQLKLWGSILDMLQESVWEFWDARYINISQTKNENSAKRGYCVQLYYVKMKKILLLNNDEMHKIHILTSIKLLE